MQRPIPGDNFIEKVDAFIEDQMRRFSIPGVALAIVECDRTVHLRGFGRSRPGGGPPTPQTPFFIGSLTKSFTALVVMQLVEAGKVSLDAPVRHYLPWFRVADPVASARMTVRHLLNHTSGIPVWVGLEDLSVFDGGPDATQRQARLLSTLKLNRPVGAKFEYANTNYNLLGLVIEAASGEAYADYIQSHIFDPLEMRHSYTSKAAAQRDALAVGHRYWFGFPIPEPDLSVPEGSLPSGQLISCAEDMAHYLLVYLNQGRCGQVQLLSPAGIEEMLRGTAAINEMGMSLGAYGMGWIDQEIGNSRIVSHSGIVPDFGGFMALVPGQKRGLVMLFNVNHAMMKMTFDELGGRAAQLVAGEVPAPARLGAAPWLMRGMLLFPLLQIFGAAGTLSLLRRWKAGSATRPKRGRLVRQHILLPLVPNLLVALSLVAILGKMRGFIRLFMPDFAWIARICGGFALVWACLRTGLVLQAWRKKEGDK